MSLNSSSLESPPYLAFAKGLPVVMGLILVAAAVFQKTGTSDVQSWPSSSEGDEADPYEKMQAEHMDDMDNEEADIEDMENGDEGLTRPAYSDPSYPSCLVR
ncbi:unnamed protein product [Closterium sp. Yama58-4]|nr:unnamed protein product [Closterium sp. Yama58-4]